MKEQEQIIEGVEKDRLAEVEQEIRHRLERYLDGTSYRFNPDAAVVEEVIKGLAIRRLKTGHEYCPCRVVTGNEEKDKKIVCPCDYHKKEIKHKGRCYCGLLVGPDYRAEG
ncbi:MAG: ferredoxin-thioredoxin reductase catalytic domain-containing protein [Candidatus Brocadiales bacterium]|nr:ferredoxin-thioredoxin reductase catalytic domain-containing protein [Candidatus Brocadiales bacterium]